MNNVEHRLKKRHKSNAAVYINWKDRLTPATIIDISPTGALIESNNLSCPANVRLTVCCTINKKFYEIQAITIHSHQHNTGIEFLTQQTEFYNTVIESTQSQKYSPHNALTARAL